MPEPRPFTSRTKPSKAEGAAAAIPQPGEVANLTILATNKAGAVLAWGGPEELLLPWREVRHEQKHQIKEGKKVVVFLFWNDENRITASTRLADFLVDEADDLQEGDQVSLVIWDRTDIGVRVIVNHRYWGMVHDSDIFGKLTRGETRVGYIKALRADRKLNVSLNAPGYAKIDAIAQNLLDVLKRRGGFLPVTDKSRPEEIYDLFGISKKVFKQTLGALYKNRRILIAEDGIRLAKTT
ncbi:MAG TPA: S1-like domain-containing RNA-binding protein [Geothrix sp.]|nr:S1-like domain-containing RNA-binding protein [Geothrix sp.]